MNTFKSKSLSLFCFPFSDAEAAQRALGENLFKHRGSEGAEIESPVSRELLRVGDLLPNLSQRARQKDKRSKGTQWGKKTKQKQEVASPGVFHGKAGEQVQIQGGKGRKGNL